MTSCNECGHDKSKTCIWDHLYADTDYADDCCDFYREQKIKNDRLSRSSTTELE